MNNELFINEKKKMYSSLKQFSISNDNLILTTDEKTYKTPFTHVNLSTLSQDIYDLEPVMLFQTLYVLELFYKNELSKEEEQFIKDFTNKYLDLNDLYLSNQIDEFNKRTKNALEIPIYTAYNEIFTNSKCALVMQDTINEHSVQKESSSELGPRLVLTNPNFYLVSEEDENREINQNDRAGFGTIFLIVGTIIVASIYLAYFIINH